MLRHRCLLALLSIMILTAWLPVGSQAADTSAFSYEIEEDGVVITGYSGEETAVDIPETVDGKPVVAIGQQAFEGNSALTHVTLPESVVRIGAYAFHGCTALAEISLPAQTATIQGAAFYQCSGLQQITILNATCSIYDAPGTICDTAEIVGYTASSAEQYAARYDRAFRSLGDAPCTKHSYTAHVTKEPTCTQSGERTYTCSRCGASYTEEIAATGHTEQVIEEVPATCTQDGRSAGTVCSVCGETLQGPTTIPARGHTATTSGARPAGCTTEGETGTTSCSVCGLVLQPSQRIPAAGHDCVTETTPAQLEKDGLSVERCTVCQQEIQREEIARPESITLSHRLYTYSGAQRTPTVTLKDRQGKRIAASNYTISYPDERRSVGNYTVRVVFDGERYAGQMQSTFRIRPEATRITAVQAKSRGLRVVWKKQAVQTSGYQLQVSRSASFPKASRRTVTVSGRTSKTVKGLKRQKSYYIRVRTYQTMKDGTRNTSAWSAVKRKTTKK